MHMRPAPAPRTLTVVVVSGGNMAKVIDTRSGSLINFIKPPGKIVSSPVISGETVAFIVQESTNKKVGRVYNLRNAQLISLFTP